MNQACINHWLSTRNPDSSGWFMSVRKVSKNLKEFLKFVLTKLQMRQDEFLFFPRRILPFLFIHPADSFEMGESAQWIRIQHCLTITYEGLIHLKDVFITFNIQLNQLKYTSYHLKLGELNNRQPMADENITLTALAIQNLTNKCCIWE